MGSFGVVRLKDIIAMLNECAPGHIFKEGQHKFQVGWKGRTWPYMVRFLTIPDDCAKRMLPRLN